MDKIIIGDEFIGKEQNERETCFGILYENHNFKCVKIKDEVSLIGGGVEENETLQETLKREFQEEAGLFINVKKELYQIDCYWKTKDDIIMHSIANIFEVEEIEKTDITEDNAELVEYSADEVLDYLPLPYHKKAIKEFLKIPTVIEDTYKNISITVAEPKLNFENILIYVHGLGSSSEMIQRFARKLCKEKTAICAFDLPAHGKDNNSFEKFSLTNSLIYLDNVISYVNNKYVGCKITLFGSSYGAYVILNKLKKEAGFSAILMSPAINFPDILKEKGNINDEYYLNHEYKELYGDVKIYKDAFLEFCSHDVNEKNDNFVNVRIIHGTDDKTVDISIAIDFAKKNNIDLKIIDNEVHELYSSNSIIVDYIKENI